MIKPIAQKVGKKYNYLSSVLAAQCILETGYGGFVDRTTESMIDNNNHLGMIHHLYIDNCFHYQNNNNDYIFDNN